LRAAIVVCLAVAALLLYALVARRPPPEDPIFRLERERVRADAERARRAPARPDAAVATQPTPTTHALTLGWGNGPDQVGRRVNPESQGEGPMSFVVGKDGTTYVLDQVNHRILRRTKDGRALSPIALPRDTAQDLRVDGHGDVGVLDRLGDKTVARYDASGRETKAVPLSSLGVGDPGGATGLFDTDDGELYVEESLRRQGKRVVHGIDGASALAGRPSRDGQQLIQAAITSRNTGNLVVRGLDLDGTQRWESALFTSPIILSIVLCETDSAGDVFVGVTHAMTTSTHDLTGETLDLFRLRSDGTPVGHTSVAHAPSTLEHFRELSVGDDGTVYWMHPAADGSGIVVDSFSI